jgi:hypothetical protein
MSTETRYRAASATNMAIRTDTPDGWCDLARAWRLHLPPETRLALAVASLLACDADDAEGLIDGIKQSAGPPHAAFLSEMDQAAFWADLASPDELDAYCLTSFRRMSPHRQSAFLGYVHGRAAA